MSQFLVQGVYLFVKLFDLLLNNFNNRCCFPRTRWTMNHRKRQIGCHRKSHSLLLRVIKSTVKKLVNFYIMIQLLFFSKLAWKEDLEIWKIVMV